MDREAWWATQSMGVMKASDSTEHACMQLVSQPSFLQTYPSSSLFQEVTCLRRCEFPLKDEIKR